MRSPDRRRLLLAAAALPLAGCVVAPYGTYYRPSAGERGNLGRAWCSGAAGPLSRLTVPLGPGLELRASVQDRFRSPGRTLLIQLPLPAGGRYAWGEEPVRVAESASGRAMAVTLQPRVRGGGTLPADAWVDRPALHPAPLPAGASDAVLRLPLVGPRGIALLAFTLTAPPLQVGAALVDLPAVTMRRSANRDIGPFREPALQARMDTCKASPTSASDCAMLARSGLLSFERGVGPVRWRGQFDHFERRYDGRPLHGEIAVEVEGSEAWRWSAEGFTATDTTSGQRERLEAAALQFSYDDAVNPGQLLVVGRPGGAATHRDALLSLEAELPDDQADFVVTLPALTAHGNRIDLPALRFERRRFDGGIEPFNC